MKKLKLYTKEHKNKPIPVNLPTLSKRELEAVLDCLIADQLSQGSITKNFENIFSNTFGHRHALAVNSLTAAFHLAYLALDLKAGDCVILNPLSSEAACDAARYLTTTVYLIDIDQNSFHPAQEDILELISELKAKVQPNAKICYVADHNLGSPIPYSLTKLREAGAVIVEDFTSLVGAQKKDGYFGKEGLLAVCGFSQYDLVTVGNGAMLVTDNSQLYKKAHSLRYGAKREPTSIAYDYRLGDFQTAMGIHQINHLGLNLARRKKIALRYLESLRSTKHSTYFKNPESDTYLRFPVCIHKEPDQVKHYFRSLQIGISKITSIPLHHLLGLAPLQFPNTERLFRRSICLPLYPNLSSSNIERICNALLNLV